MPAKKWIDLLKKTRPDLWHKRMQELENEEVPQRSAGEIAKIAATAVSNAGRGKQLDRSLQATIVAYTAAIIRELRTQHIRAEELDALKRAVNVDSRTMRDDIVYAVRELESGQTIDVRSFMVALTRVITDY
jgi:NADH/NAD ratio-sensing transcriptional regulator Rex